MKNIVFVIILILFTINIGCPQSKKTSTITFKPISIDSLNYLVSEKLIDYNVFRDRYREKTKSASIDYIAWSSNGSYIAVCISNVYTGDCDDIWIVSIKNKSAYCITSIYPPNNHDHFDRPIWKGDDTIAFSMPNYNILYDAFSDKPVSQTPANGKSYLSNFSPNGDFRFDGYGSGKLPTIYSSSGKKLITIGENGGSIIGEAFSTDSKYLIVDQFMGHGNSRMILVSLKTLLSYFIKLSFSSYTEVKGISNWLPGKNIFYIVDNKGNLHVLDIFNRSDRTFILSEYFIMGAAWSPDNKKIALVVQNKKLRNYSVRIFDNPIAD
jgi:hypothetical protein